jgi:hypothetical protein
VDWRIATLYPTNPDFTFPAIAELDNQLGDLIAQNSFAAISDISKLFRPRKTTMKNGKPRRSKGYSMLCLTGEFELFDYDRGVLCLEAGCYTEPNYNGDHNVFISITCVDDGMWGAYSPKMPQPDAEALLERIAAEVLSGLSVLPCEKELNEMLVLFAMYGTFD